MNIKDLYDLDYEKVKSLRSCIGLLWHLRLNHASKAYLEIAAKVIPCLNNVKFESEIFDCLECKLAKQTCLPYQTTRLWRSVPLTLVHSDLMGPINHGAYDLNARYIVVFIDDYSRFACAYALVDKTTVHFAFNEDCHLQWILIDTPFW